MFNWKIIVVVLCFVIPSLAHGEDVVVLKNGTEVKGKILSQDKTSVTIDSGVGVGTTYYMDEITSVIPQEKISAPVSALPSSPSVSVTTEAPQHGIALTESEKTNLAGNILYLSDQSFKSITCKMSYSAFKKQDQMMQSILKMMGDFYKVDINWNEYKITFDNEGNISFIHPSVKIDMDSTLKDKLVEKDPDWESKMQQTEAQFRLKLEEGLKQTDDDLTKLMEVVTGERKSYKAHSPEKLSNGLIVDQNSINTAEEMAKLGVLIGKTPQAGENTGMTISMGYWFEAVGEKFIIKESSVDIKMPQIMDAKVHYAVAYQHLEDILFPGQITIISDARQASDEAENSLVQKTKDTLSFDQCVVLKE